MIVKSVHVCSGVGHRQRPVEILKAGGVGAEC